MDWIEEACRTRRLPSIHSLPSTQPSSSATSQQVPQGGQISTTAVLEKAPTSLQQDVMTSSAFSSSVDISKSSQIFRASTRVGSAFAPAPTRAVPYQFPARPVMQPLPMLHTPAQDMISTSARWTSTPVSRDIHTAAQAAPRVAVHTTSCSVCGTVETPRWRYGFDRSRVCNACGLQIQKRKRAMSAQQQTTTAEVQEPSSKRNKVYNISYLLNPAAESAELLPSSSSSPPTDS
eukprot:GILJ01011796.1.p1 GENE.GILJ01011796.1~~GILJ01011796.1.p1  ORF type:complete len:234 (-),score=20.56 GILJ01011796.1:168-869(-)